MALAAARANAALDGNEFVTEDDARVAASLVLAPRATRLPPVPEEADAPEPEAHDHDHDHDHDHGHDHD